MISDPELEDWVVRRIMKVSSLGIETLVGEDGDFKVNLGDKLILELNDGERIPATAVEDAASLVWIRSDDGTIEFRKA